jgi:hypothetical protein
VTTLNQLWMGGVLVAFSVFGIKVGLGLGAQIYSQAISVRKKIVFLIGTLFAYLLLFYGLFCLITRFSLLNYFWMDMTSTEFPTIPMWSDSISIRVRVSNAALI